MIASILSDAIIVSVIAVVVMLFIGLPIVLMWSVARSLKGSLVWARTYVALVLAAALAGPTSLALSYAWLAGELSEQRVSMAIHNGSDTEIVVAREHGQDFSGSNFYYTRLVPGQNKIINVGIYKDDESSHTECPFDSRVNIIRVDPGYTIERVEDPEQYRSHPLNIPSDRYQTLSEVPVARCTPHVWLEWDGYELRPIGDPRFGLPDYATLAAGVFVAIVLTGVVLDLRRRRIAPAPLTLDEHEKPGTTIM